MRKSVLLLLPVLAMTGGCLSTVGSIVTAPVKIAGQAADWATTSQDESDRNYGRKMRRKEAQEGRERRDFQKKCRDNPRRDGCGEYGGYRAGYDN
jgi:hypothetical protein